MIQIYAASGIAPYLFDYCNGRSWLDDLVEFDRYCFFFYYSYISWYSCTDIFHIIDDSPNLPTFQLDGDETAEDSVREPKV